LSKQLVERIDNLATIKQLGHVDPSADIVANKSFVIFEWCHHDLGMSVSGKRKLYDYLQEQ
jgi:hypothetical protein